MSCEDKMEETTEAINFFILKKIYCKIKDTSKYFLVSFTTSSHLMHDP